MSVLRWLSKFMLLLQHAAGIARCSPSESAAFFALTSWSDIGVQTDQQTLIRLSLSLVIESFEILHKWQMRKPKRVSVFMSPLYTGSQQTRAGYYSFSPSAAFILHRGCVTYLGGEDAELSLAAPGHLRVVAWVLSIIKLAPLTVSS